MVSFSVNIVCAQDLQVEKHGTDPGLPCFSDVFNHVFRGGWLQSLIKPLRSLIPRSIVLFIGQLYYVCWWRHLHHLGIHLYSYLCTFTHILL
jgi:hypothetical protein